jgi:hypothetical protein
MEIIRAWIIPLLARITKSVRVKSTIISNSKDLSKTLIKWSNLAGRGLTMTLKRKVLLKCLMKFIQEM